MLESVNRLIPDFLLKPGFRFYRHLAIHLLVVLITVNILWDEPDQVLGERLAGWFIYYLQIIIIIYGNMYVLVPRLLIKGKIFFYLLSLITLMLCTVYVMSLLQQAFMTDDSNPPPVLLESIASLVAFVVFSIGLTVMILFKYHLGNMRKISELEHATTTIELANLQSQINPHFLFNTLNNANFLAEEDAEKSSYILKKLNDLLKYQTDGEAKGNVVLQDDIDFLNDYLNLEKTRRDRFNYSIEVVGDCHRMVPPLLFIPFIENAVKHNPENDSYVNIVFKVKEDRLYFECVNPKARLSHPKKEGGIGLVNIRKRLDLLFGKEYSLNLYDDVDKFTVVMEIQKVEKPLNGK